MDNPKVLVANRGEIAVRICRTAEELGWRRVALYTEKDVSHASYADEAVLLDSPARYMDPQHLADVAIRMNCTHVHPGYGFLSESPEFASLFTAPTSPSTSRTARPIFIGPSVETLNIASDKMLSRDLATSCGVPVAPGTRVNSVGDIHQFVAQLGSSAFPIVLKALDGGGGRGIRLVSSVDAIEDAYKRCIGESPSKRVFAEKALVGPGWKHVEVQIVGDGHGGVVHLWERECSVQRRFQKIVEMAPSTLEPAVIQPLLDAAMKMARQLKYAGIGTFEFLVNARSHEWIFLEINPRIQVEHTVTEEVVGVDLVRVQLLLSVPGTSLRDVLPQSAYSSVRPRCHAIQMRLVAEDPHNSFRLFPGTIQPSDVWWPAGRGVRVDTWLCAGPHTSLPLEWTVGVDFDSLLAKLVVSAETFDEATARAKRALRELRLSGEVKTNVELLAGVVSHPDWRDAKIHTRWLEEHIDEVLVHGKERLGEQRNSSQTTASESSRSPPTNSGSADTIILQPGASFQLSISPPNPGAPGAQDSTQKHNLVLSTIGHNAFPTELSGTLTTSLAPTPLAFSLTQLAAVPTSAQVEFANVQDPTHLSCPLAGKIVELHPALVAPEPGFIRAGEPLVVVSVMKMESVVSAERSGKVSRVGRGVEIGAVVPEGVLVCVLDVEKEKMSRL